VAWNKGLAVAAACPDDGRMLTTTSTAAYAIDAEGRVVWVDDGFTQLAAEHGQPGLAERVLGRPLVDHVAGERPRALYRALIDRVKRAVEPIELRYRCDSADERRFGVLRLVQGDDGGILFETWFESIEPRPHQPLLDYELERDDRIVWLCAWCNRLDASGWCEVEDAQERLAKAPETLPRVQHSVCDICELLLTSRAPGAAGPRP
jgi:hypothetical protein